jgi:deazaflavin-dependent oxidoreductase (nitroreductase family)
VSQRYIRPDWFTKNVLNPSIQLLTRLGLSVYGSRILAVRGRKSGEWRTNPVNLLEFQGKQYLVAPRGVTEWVRNIRVSGSGELRLGARRQSIRVEELADSDKPALLGHYLRKWKWEAGQFFEGVDADAPDAEIVRISPNHPVFRIV